MEEVEQQPDVIEQEAVAPVEQTSQSQQPQEKPVDSKEYNWRRLEKRNQDLEVQVEELRNSLTVKDSDDLASLSSEDLASIGQVEKLAQIQAKKMIEEELNKREKQQLPIRAKAKFADYDSIVTAENIEKLIQEDPDLEHDLQVSKNPYERAYKEIKRSEFYKELSQGNVAEKRMEENSEKPGSVSSLGKQRPLSQANTYAKGSPELWQEMVELGKGGY